MKFAVLAFTLLLAVASEAAAMPTEESSIQQRFTEFKTMVHQLKDMVDRAIVNTQNSQELQTPSMISQALGNFFIMLSSNEEAIIASITASQEIISQMTGAGDLSAELETGVANLDRVFKNHLSEYNVLLMPIVAEFKTASLQFRDMATPRVNVLREAFNRNLAETVKALNSVFHTILKMAVNFRTAVDMYVEEYRRSMQEFYRTIENLSPEERERRKREMETIVQEILTKFQKLYEVASGAAPAS